MRRKRMTWSTRGVTGWRLVIAPILSLRGATIGGLIVFVSCMGFRFRNGGGTTSPDDWIINIKNLTLAEDPPIDVPPVDHPPIPGLSDPIIQAKHLPEVFVDPVLTATERHFALGAVPIGAPGPSITDEVLENTIQQTAEIAECYVIRQKIDWEAYRPGGRATPDFTDDIIRLLDLAKKAGFSKTLVELDPIVNRHTIGPLPPALEGRGFDDSDVRTALQRQALRVAEEGRPDYLSLAVEVNGYFESNPDDFANFVDLQKELYDQVKSVSPETSVMASFNLEAIQGLLRGVGEFADHGPQWFLIDMFEPKLDAVAFSTLPFPVFFSPKQIPDEYYAQIQEHTARPIVLAEVGWTTSVDANSNEAAQRDFLALVARQALNVPQLHVFCWTILYDAESGSIFDAFPAFKELGLLRFNGEPKLAMSVWRQLHEATYIPETTP